ncbi:MAG: beta strand repeat-containing protein, partial [Candidatus Kapaibacteriota bacterium]
MAFAVQYWWRTSAPNSVWTNPANWSTVGFASATNTGSYPGAADIATFGLLGETPNNITFTGTPTITVGAIHAQTLQRILTFPAGVTLVIASTGSDAGGNAVIEIAPGATMRILPLATVQGAGGAHRWQINGTLELVDNGAVISSGMGFAAGSTLLYSGAGTKTAGNEFTDGNTNMPYTVFPGNIIVNKTADLTIPFNMEFNNTVTVSGTGNLVVGVSNSIAFGAGSIINTPSTGRIKVDNLNTVYMRKSGFNSLVFFNSWIFRLVIDFATAVFMTSNLTVGGGGLDFVQAGNLFLNGATTLTLEGNGSNHVTGVGAGRVEATNPAAVVNLVGNPQLNGAKFVLPIQTLRTGAAPAAAPVLNAGTFAVNNLDHANGSITLSVPLTLNAGGTHTIATGGPTRTLDVASGGNLIIQDAATLTNNGAVNIQAGGALEMQGNATFNGTAPNYAAASILRYTGATTKIVTAEWSGTMAGQVIINKGAGNFLGLNNAPTRNQNGVLTVQSGTFDVQIAGNLALGGAVHTIQNGADLRIFNGGTVSGLGNLSVNGGGRFSIIDNGGTAPVRAGTPNYSSGSILFYGGNTNIPTGSEFPNMMAGSVEIANTTSVVQQAGTTKTVAGTFSFIGPGIYSINGSTGNGLVLNGPLVNTATGYFQAFNNNFTINNTVTGNLRFGPTVAEQTLNNFTMGGASAAITLGAPIVIGAAGTLNLNGGNITTTAAESLTITNTAPAAVTRTNGFIDGPLIRAMTAAGVYLFPTGRGGQYLPLSFTNPGAVTVAASAFNANPMGTSGTGLTNPSTTEYWLTNVTAGAYGAGASVTLQRPANFGANTVVGRRDAGTSAGAYNSVGPTGYGGGFNVITSDILTTPAAPMFFTTGQGAQPATGLVFSNITNTSFDAIFTAPTPVPTGYVVVRRLASSPSTSPTNGVLPAVGSALGVGTVISNNASTGVFANSPLTLGTEYAIDVYSYTGAMATPSYLTGQILTGNVTTTGGAGCSTIAPPAMVDVSLYERIIRYTGVSLTGGGGVLAGNGTNLVYVNPSTP